MLRTSLALTSASVLVVTLTACGGDSRKQSEQYAEGGTFTIAVRQDPGGVFSPYHGNFVGFNEASPLAYDSLVNLRPGGEVVSGIAEEWAAGVSRADFTLKEGVLCSDGHELVASDVAAAIEYVNDPDNESIMYGLRVPTTPLVVSADDDARTVHIESEEPFSFLLNTIGTLPIVCPEGLKDVDALNDATFGTGPYELTDAIPAQSYTFALREGYTWGPDGASTDEPGMPASVVLRVVDTDATAANLLLEGEVNLSKVTSQDRTRLDAQDIDSYTTTGGGGWLFFNGRDGSTTADENVRQALVHGVNYEQMVAILTENGATGTAATSLTPNEYAPCQGQTVPPAAPDYDVAAAEALLDESGWTIGSDGFREKDGQRLTLNFRYATYDVPAAKAASEFAAEAWGKLGIDVSLTEDTYDQTTQWWFETGDFDVSINAIGFNLSSDAPQYLSGPSTPEGSNIFGIQNEEYTQLVADAAQQAFPEACDVFEEAETSLWMHADMLPISDRVDRFYVAGGEAEAPVFGTNVPIPTSLRVFE